MKARYLALLALLCVAGCALRPALAQDCGGKTADTCVDVLNDVDTGCCTKNGTCEATSADNAASPADGACRGRIAIDTSETSFLENCGESTAILCNPGSTAEPAGCRVSKCFVTLPPLGANGKPNWSAAVSGGANSSEVAKCYKGLNWQVDTEGDQAFKYEDGVPVAVIVPKYKSLTITSPYGGNPRPTFRITRVNVTMEGNFTVAYQASLFGGAGDREGPLTLTEAGDYMQATGAPRGMLTRFALQNKGEDNQGTLYLHRITINVC